jgi:hypothetical protein
MFSGGAGKVRSSPHNFERMFAADSLQMQQTVSVLLNPG